MVKSGQVWTGLFVTKDATGALATPSVGPAGVLYVDGTADAASVTVSGTNPYKWAVTLPTLTAGQSVSMYITATIATVDTGAVVAEDQVGTPLTAQETANAVHNLAPVGTVATGSIGNKLNVIDANVDAIKLTTDDLDVSAVTQVVASSAGHLTITVGLTLDEGVTGLTIPADWVTALWTLKNNARDADTAALVQLRVTNPAAGNDGLQRLNGAALVAPITAADGELTVTQATGRIDVRLSDEMTVMLGAATAIGWDVKFIDAAGDSTGQRGTADVVLTETKSTA